MDVPFTELGTLVEEQILENVGQELSFGHVQCENLLGVDMQVDC